MHNTTPCNPSLVNLRSKGLSTAIGKVYKGCVKDAATKLSIGSIPSTYESIIYKIDNKKAFGTSQQRFYSKDKGSVQQISDYQQPSLVETQTTKTSINSSSNAIGYGPLISKSKRQWMRITKTPGPGQYHRDSLRKCVTRQEKIRKRSFIYRNKQHKAPESTMNSTTPGPGEYHYQKKQQWNTVNKGWKSSFQTKGKRDDYIPQTPSPGPGVYELSPTRASTKNKNNTNKQNCSAQKKLPKNIIQDIIAEQKYGVPGPGSYEHQIPDFKPLYEKIKVSKNFMSSIMSTKNTKHDLGPTYYDVKRMYDNMTPKLLQSPVFMSECKREAFINPDNQGPGVKPIPLEQKKNFHFNIKNNWI